MRAKGDEANVAVDLEAASEGRSGLHDPLGGAALRIEGLRHSFGELEVLDGIDLELGPRETVALVGPSGCGKSTLLELVGRARGTQRAAGSPSPAGTDARRAARRLRLHAAARAAAALAAGDRQRRARAAAGGQLGARRAADGGTAVRAPRARRLRARLARGALRRHAPARRLRPHPADRQGDAAARRALRRARRDHPRRPAELAARGARRRAADRAARHPRRRGGAVRRRPRRRPLAAARARRLGRARAGGRSGRRPTAPRSSPRLGS